MGAAPTERWQFTKRKRKPDPMFQDSSQGAVASTDLPTTVPQFEVVRHMVFGSLDGVQHTIRLLHRLNYAEPNDWSRLLSTGRPNEVMAILTRRVRVG